MRRTPAPRRTSNASSPSAVDGRLRLRCWGRLPRTRRRRRHHLFHHVLLALLAERIGRLGSGNQYRRLRHAIVVAVESGYFFFRLRCLALARRRCLLRGRRCPRCRYLAVTLRVDHQQLAGHHLPRNYLDQLLLGQRAGNRSCACGQRVPPELRHRHGITPKAVQKLRGRLQVPAHPNVFPPEELIFPSATESYQAHLGTRKLVNPVYTAFSSTPRTGLPVRLQGFRSSVRSTAAPAGSPRVTSRAPNNPPHKCLASSPV